MFVLIMYSTLLNLFPPSMFWFLFFFPLVAANSSFPSFLYLFYLLMFNLYSYFLFSLMCLMVRVFFMFVFLPLPFYIPSCRQLFLFPNSWRVLLPFLFVFIPHLFMSFFIYFLPHLYLLNLTHQCLNH